MKMLSKEYRYLGDNITNNVAEYESIILPLERAVNLNISLLCIQDDSKLIIQQVTGQCDVNLNLCI